MPLSSLCSLLHFQCVYAPPSTARGCDQLLNTSFEKCFFLDPFLCFLNGTHLSIMPSISYVKKVHHYFAVRLFRKLFQYIFARYVCISLYLPLLKFLPRCFFIRILCFYFYIKMDRAMIVGQSYESLPRS